MQTLRVALIAAWVSTLSLSAQAPTPSPTSTDVAFDVVSVKPNNSGSTSSSTSGRAGSFTASNVTARQLIIFAYRLRQFQLTGGPGWISADRYDVAARPPESAKPDNPAMTRALLRDRFKLVFHTEKRELPIYALVVQRSDGRLGPGLKRIPDDECPPPGSPRRGGPPPPAASPFDPNAVAACGSIIFGPGRLLAHGVPIDMLSRSLANLPAITSFNRPVTNLTKLEGMYDFDFRFANEFGRGGPPPVSGPAAAPNAITPGDEPALFTALQEQLGLKLNSQRATLDVLVIDSIDRPTEN